MAGERRGNLTTAGVPKPPLGIRVRMSPDSVYITRRTLMLYHVIAAPFAVAFLYVAVRDFTAGTYNARSIGLFVAGVYFGMHALVGAINRRRIIVSPFSIQVMDGPLPTLGALKVTGPGLVSVSVTSESVRGFRSRSYYWRIDGNLQDGRVVTIDRVLENEKQARFIGATLREICAQWSSK
jgi:hypothetical protein